MRRKAAAPLLLVALVGIAAFAPTAGATWQGKPGRIAFDALDNDDGCYCLYFIRPDGTGLRRIASEFGDNFVDETGAWTRDGKRLVYTTLNDATQASALWEVKSDGSGRRRILQLPAENDAVEPQWSPDGKRVIFVRGSAEIWTVKRDGTGLRKLIDGQVATWSASGLIAYADEDGDVFTMRPDKSDRRTRLERRDRAVYSLDFSPDGRKLAILDGPFEGGSYSVRTHNLRTGKSTRYSPEPRHVVPDVLWVPDSHRLAYVHSFDVGEPRDLFRTILPDGKDMRTQFGFARRFTTGHFAWQTLP